MSTLVITRPPQFLDPWFNEIEQVWDELEAATNDQESRITTLESAILSDVVTSLSASGNPQLTGDIVLDTADDVTLQQVGNTITIGGAISDHGNLTGLSDDDHTQYLLADGTRSISGNISFTNHQALSLRLENLTSAPAAGNQGRVIFNTSTLQPQFDNGTSFSSFGVTDHGALTGLSDDDHPQYLLTSGARAVTGDFTVNGMYLNEAGEPFAMESQEVDSGTAVGFILDTANTLSTSGALLVSVRNSGTEFLSLDKSGNLDVFGDITLGGLVDGRDIALDGSTLDSHLDGGPSKHDANEIDVEGTYTNSASSPTDLETVISEFDTAISNASDNLGDHTATQDLDMGPYDIIRTGSNSIWTVDPSGSASTPIQNAIQAASDAGGGVIQLKAGTYTIDSVITLPSDANNVCLRGVNGTILDSTVPALGGLPQYIIDWRISPGLSVTDKVLNAVTKNSTSVFTTTASEAAAYLEGMFVVISGVDAASEQWMEINEVAADGDGGTGEIQLRAPIKFSLSSSVTITGHTYGRKCTIENISFTHASGAAHAIRASGLWDFKLHNCFFDGTGFSQNYALDLLLYRSTVFNNTIINYNLPETGTIGTGTELSGIDVKFDNNIIHNCGNNTKANRAGINVKNCYDIIVSNNTISHCFGSGIRIYNSTIQRNVIVASNSISGSGDHGIEVIDSSSSSDIVIDGNQVTSNGLDGSGNGIQATGVRLTISDNTCTLNQDNGINAGGQYCSIVGNIVRRNNDGIVLQSCDNSTVSGNISVDQVGTNNSGIYLNACSELVISNNISQGNTRGIRSTSNDTDIVISGNDCRGNSTYNLQLVATSTNFDVTGNDFSNGSVSLSTGTGHRFSNNRGLVNALSLGSTQTAASTNSANESVILVTDTSSARTITLDSDDVVDGRLIIIKDASGAAGTNNITIDTEGSETIDGASSVVITVNYGVVRLCSDGSNWFTF